MTGAEKAIMMTLINNGSASDANAEITDTTNTSAQEAQSSTVEQSTETPNKPTAPTLPPEIANAYKDLYESTLQELNNIKQTVTDLKAQNAKLAITTAGGDATKGIVRAPEEVLANIFVSDYEKKKNTIL